MIDASYRLVVQETPPCCRPVCGSLVPKGQKYCSHTLCTNSIKLRKLRMRMSLARFLQEDLHNILVRWSLSFSRRHTMCLDVILESSSASTSLCIRQERERDLRVRTVQLCGLQTMLSRCNVLPSTFLLFGYLQVDVCKSIASVSCFGL